MYTIYTVTVSIYTYKVVRYLYLSLFSYVVLVLTVYFFVCTLRTTKSQIPYLYKGSTTIYKGFKQNMRHLFSFNGAI